MADVESDPAVTPEVQRNRHIAPMIIDRNRSMLNSTGAQFCVRELAFE
jgi:hypothetical protein